MSGFLSCSINPFLKHKICQRCVQALGCVCRALLAAPVVVSAPGGQPPDTPDKPHHSHPPQKTAQFARTPRQDHEISVVLTKIFCPTHVHGGVCVHI